MSKSLNYRKDIRSLEKFKEDILSATKREKYLLGYWATVQLWNGHNIEYFDHGIDNSGEFIEGNTDNRPDYKVILNSSSFLCEIKANEYKHKNTFKVSDLERYIKDNARILLFYNLGKSMKNLGITSRWAFIEPEAQQRMLDNLPVVKDPKWGYKPVVILYDKDFNKYFKTENL